MLRLLVEGMIFQPSPGVDLEPAAMGIDARDVFLDVEGERAHGFYLPHANANRAILFLHGNAGNASHRLPNAAQLQQLAANVFVLDYRGYGRSEGKATERGTYADARAALDHLTGTLGFASDRVVVFGRSLGGAIAVDLVKDRDFAGLVLESTFTSVREVVQSLFKLPLGAFVGDRFDSKAKIARLERPLLMFHGNRDEIVPFDIGRRLYDAAPKPKDFYEIAGAGHNDTVSVGGRAYFERFRAFLDQVTPL